MGLSKKGTKRGTKKGTKRGTKKGKNNKNLIKDVVGGENKSNLKNLKKSSRKRVLDNFIVSINI